MNRRQMAKTLCPQCGYDLHGVMSAQDGTSQSWFICSECGFRVDTVDPVPKWLFEYRDERWIQKWLSTVLQSLNPARFWRSVGPDIPPRVGVLLVFQGSILLALHFAGAFISTLCWFRMLSMEWPPSGLSTMGKLQSAAIEGLWPYRLSTQWAFSKHADICDWTFLLTVFWVYATAAVFYRVTRASAPMNHRIGFWCRGVAYSLVPMAFLLILWVVGRGVLFFLMYRDGYNDWPEFFGAVLALTLTTRPSLLVLAGLLQIGCWYCFARVYLPKSRTRLKIVGAVVGPGLAIGALLLI